MMRKVAILTLCVIGALAPADGGLMPDLRAQVTVESFRSFQGTWSATGDRQTLATEAERPAAIARLSGALTLTGMTGLSSGFRGEAIAFDDGRLLNVGRAVWTDARGDRVFSELKGEPLQTGRRVTGTITGGTGRYAGATGDYEFTWQYVVGSEDDAVHGRATDVRGRIRIAGGQR